MAGVAIGSARKVGNVKRSFHRQAGNAGQNRTVEARRQGAASLHRRKRLSRKIAYIFDDAIRAQPGTSKPEGHAIAVRHLDPFVIGDVEVLPLWQPLAPVFTQHMEFRLTGPLPLSGGEPRASGWVRPRTPPRAWISWCRRT